MVAAEIGGNDGDGWSVGRRLTLVAGEYYDDILPIIMDKIRRDKRKEVHARLDFREGSRERRIREGHRRQSAFDQLSETYSPSTTKSRLNRTSSRDHSHGRSRSHKRDSSNGDRPQSRNRSRVIGESYDNSHSSYGTGINNGYRYCDRYRSRHVKRGRDRVARVWFDELPPKRIDSYKNLKAAFLAYFMQQKKYVKDPVEIHNIKQKDGETTEDLMEWFKVETGRMKGAPECMRIFRFMHGVNNPKLTKRLNEHVPKTMEEMMITTTAFIRGEVTAAGKKKGHTSWRTQDQLKWHASEKRSDFRDQLREGRGSSRFTPLTRTPKEILAAEAKEFQPPPPMIEELVRAGKLSHLIKEIKQGRDQSKVGKKEAPAKDKSMEIYMIQSWQIMTREKVTQSFERVREITFPSLATNSGTEGPFVIEAEIGGHMIHRIPGIKEIQAVPSTAHGMLKFLADGGILTIRSTILIPAECVTVITLSKEIPKEVGVHHENFKVALHPNFPDQEVAIGGTLSAKRRIELCSLLKENLDIFTGQSSDMTRVPRSVAEHQLYPGGIFTRSAKEKRSGLETPKGHPSRGTEISRGGDHEREIDWKVESLCGYPFKCFMDAYKVYHQIQLAESDEEKMAFHTGHGVYCYTKMPFGLKNVGATYRRLVDKSFDSQIGRNIEVYVDDLVIKSHTEAEILRDINETFRTLQKINMKLNPKKCTFRAVEGMFLGYMITPEGIKPCPDKTKAVLQLPSLRTIKETSKVEQAFKQLKQHLSELPLLVAPKPKEELIVYMSASYGAISAVLTTESGMILTPVYFVSRALQGSKLNYTPMEKLVLSLVFAAKRLWRTSLKGHVLVDFLAEIRDESPPDASVVETQQEPWILFTDGSSCVDGSGAGPLCLVCAGVRVVGMMESGGSGGERTGTWESVVVEMAGK
uniref:Reverse transcriptase domain-containing protein n=1 Tax=Tanacetum cinerariifolium TaxID=118510 RepID=A0A6L2LVA4_TANCI|nr:hypothetical protein [Tanacetum cinerariifolium]